MKWSLRFALPALLLLVCSMFAAATATAYSDGLLSADYGYSANAVMPALDAVLPAVDTGERLCAVPADTLTPTLTAATPTPPGGAAPVIASIDPEDESHTDDTGNDIRQSG